MESFSSGLKKSPSYRETKELLEQHIRRQKLLKKYSGQPSIQNASDIRKEAEKILNEFLKRQLQKENKQSPILSQHYQKVVVENEYEQTKEFDDECKMKGENFSGDEGEIVAFHASVDAIDDIPFIDGEDDDDGRSKSLPTSMQLSVKQPAIPKSKSLSPQRLLTKDSGPDNQVEYGHDELDSPERELDSPEHKSIPSKFSSPSQKDLISVEPVQVRRRFKSGSLSSSDTDTGAIVSPDRKKKSVFKRLQERFARAVSRDREHMEKDDRKLPDESKKKKRKRKARSKKRKSDHGSDIDILREKHTHRTGHVEQHHCGENNEILLKTNETWESTDITDFEKSQSRHLDKHTKVKESTDLSGSSEKGLFGAFKRITSRKGKKTKSPKSSLKYSQSAYTQEPPGTNGTTRTYDRILSVPSGSHDLNLHLTETTTDTSRGRHRHTTKTVTSPNSHEKRGLPKMEPVHEKSRSEPVQPSQPMVDSALEPAGRTIPHGFKFRQFSGEEDVKIPENKSFTIDFTVDEKERTFKTKDGNVQVETDIHRSQLMPPDLEMDGAGMSVAAGGTSPRPAIQQHGRPMPESDIDDDMDEARISRVAARIAEMGDTYISGTSQVSSPTRSPDERDGEGLTELERKIRDCFRDFGDTVNQRLSMSVEPRQAALDIATQVTYSKFKDTVHSIVGDHLGWQQLAMVFYVTKKATQLAGAGGAVASQLKENCLQYVEDHFASWILNQGGWDSVFESDETDFDID